MRAIVLERFDPPSLQVRRLPLPVLHRGQVLVKIAAAPINPSDLIFLRNQYGIQKPLPVVPGFEGSGTVVAAKGGFYTHWLVGRRVACRAPEDGNGTWAEYMACQADRCIPLKSFVALEEGATLVVNPMTAWCLLDRIRRERHRAFIQSAAASALGRMISRLSRRYGLKSIHIVRRREQADLLRREGAACVLDSSEPGFEESLHRICREVGATIALDAVGGELTAQMARSLPRCSKVVVYGVLSGEACQINPSDLIFSGKQLTGFWLSEAIKRMGWFARLGMIMDVQRLLKKELRTDVQARFPLEKIQEAIDFYKKNRTRGKVLLVP
ncbi:MAG: zinc-binding dehydrogenase [Elusimicrobiota bacterium]|jgi:NADPH:quinone reductase-like Zn-dependent oxidoreductase